MRDAYVVKDQLITFIRRIENKTKKLKIKIRSLRVQIEGLRL